MIGHEASFSAPGVFAGRVNDTFTAELKHAGWITGPQERSHPVKRHAVGRVAEGYIQDENGQYAMRVSEYYTLKPHDMPMFLIPGEKVIGYTGQELRVSFTMPIEQANKLKFSHSNAPAAEVIPMGRISVKAA